MGLCKLEYFNPRFFLNFCKPKVHGVCKTLGDSGDNVTIHVGVYVRVAFSSLNKLLLFSETLNCLSL
jgi:hypothetical protein